MEILAGAICGANLLKYGNIEILKNGNIGWRDVVANLFFRRRLSQMKFTIIQYRFPLPIPPLCNPQHFAAQYAGFWPAICGILRRKTHSFAMR